MEKEENVGEGKYILWRKRKTEKEKEEIMEAWIRSKPLPTMDRQVADKYADEFLKKADKKTINDSNDNNNKEKSFKKIKF